MKNSQHTQLTLAEQINAIELYDDNHRKKTSTLLIDIGSLFTLFHDNRGDCYAIIYNQQKKLVYRLQGHEFISFLRECYFQRWQTGVNDKNIQEALDTLKAKAKFDGQQHPVYRRIAKQAHAIYVDLNNHHGEAIEIKATGWQVIQNPPVHFLQSQYAHALPTPTCGGDINRLWQYLNVRQEDKVLIWAWLLACLKPTPPYPLLLLHGSQGSGKSSASKIIKRIIDPNAGESTQTPKDERNLIAYALNHHLLCFDNNSYIDNELSDYLCRIASGASISVRKLYTDADELIYNLARPILINGISNNIHRGDLLERTITVELQSLEETNRRTETNIFRAFETDLPFILGALYDDAANAIASFQKVKPKALPRMADFAKWVIAAELTSNSFSPNDFMTAYQNNILDNAKANLAENPLALALQTLIHQWVQQKLTGWKGTASELLYKLNQLTNIPDSCKRAQQWPKDHRALGKALERLIPEFKKTGTHIQRIRTGNERLIAINFAKEIVSKISCHPCHNSDNVVKNNKNSDDIAKKHLSHLKSLLTSMTNTVT